jgi:hypothetical protein
VLTADRKTINNSILRIKNKINLSEIDKLLFNNIEKGPELRTRVQAIFERNFLDSELDRALFDIILNASIKIEKLFPGSIQEFLLDFFKRYPDHFCDIEKSILSRKANWDDVSRTVDELDLTSHDRDLFLSALEIAGFGAKISLEKTSSAFSSIEKVMGYNFNSSSPILQKRLLLDNVYIIPVDGFIESVSEIHHLLEIAHADKLKIILVIRGAHNDVFNTLKVNLERGTLFVIPTIVKFDVEGINTLADIAVVSNNDVVSMNKGELISQINVKNFKQVKKVEIDQKSMTIFNLDSKKNVESHISFLRKKRDDASVADLQQLLTSRLKSLFSNHVIIRLPDDETFKVKSEKFDILLRDIQRLLSNGVFDKKSHPLYGKILNDLLTTIGDLGAVLIE